MIAKVNEILSDRSAYEFSTRHLKNQDKRSIRESNDCVYRQTNQIYSEIDGVYEEILCCAVGCLIADEMYEEDIEDQGVIYQPVISALESSHPSWNIDRYSILLLQILQSIHDHGEPKNWSIFFNMMDSTLFQSENEKVTDGELFDLVHTVRHYLDLNDSLPYDIIQISRNIINLIEGS